MLEMISSGLTQSCSIIQSTLDVASALEDCCKRHENQTLAATAMTKEMMQSLANDIRRLRSFERAATALVRRADSAAHLVGIFHNGARQSLMEESFYNCYGSGEPTSKMPKRVH